MIILKEVRQSMTWNGLEATWVDRTVAPDTKVPEVPEQTITLPQQEISPGVFDAVLRTQVIPAVPAHTIPGAVTDIQVKCHSYADTQMDMFRADAAAFGTPLDDYEDMIADIESKIVPYVPPPPVVPQVISMRQARLALYGAGLLDDVEAAVAQSTKDVQIEYEYATELNRQWPTLVFLAGALGLTDEQLDNLFIQASQL